MATYTYRAVNLTGVFWIERGGLASWSSRSFGLQCVETGRFLASAKSSPGPAAWTHKSTVDEFFVPNADAFGIGDDTHTWVDVVPPAKPASGREKKHREFWSAPQHVQVFRYGARHSAYRNVDHVSAWVIARGYLTREKRREGYTVTVTPSILEEG
jgi:hypothetical protein